MVWASRWSVALRAFYRQILSSTYSFFSLKLPPPDCPGTTGSCIMLYVYKRLLEAVILVTDTLTTGPWDEVTGLLGVLVVLQHGRGVFGADVQPSVPKSGLHVMQAV